MIARNTAAELGWLQQLAHRAPGEHPDPAAFVEGVLARLDAHGHTIDNRPLRALIREVEEELLDVAGWSLLTLQVHHDASPTTRTMLREVSTLAALAHGLLTDCKAALP